METAYVRRCRLALVLAVTVTTLGAPGRADADPGPGASAFPGMEIRQGNAVCRVALVEPERRIALTTGQCDGGDSAVADRDGNVIGSVLVARRQTAAGAGVDSALQPVEYEVIALAPEVTATDLLPTGRHLRSAPVPRPEPGLAVCQLGSAAGESCGSVGSVSNGRFVVAGTARDGGDVGGPVYVRTDGDAAAIVGLLEGGRTSSPEVESWQAIMQQLAIDTGSRGGQPSSPGVRMISGHRRPHADDPAVRLTGN